MVASGLTYRYRLASLVSTSELTQRGPSTALTTPPFISLQLNYFLFSTKDLPLHTQAPATAIFTTETFILSAQIPPGKVDASFRGQLYRQHFRPSSTSKTKNRRHSRNWSSYGCIHARRGQVKRAVRGKTTKDYRIDNCRASERKDAGNNWPRGSFQR